jgi:hypothetical protein
MADPKNNEAKQRDHMLDHTVEESFPASDPPSTDPDPLPELGHEDKEGA